MYRVNYPVDNSVDYWNISLSDRFNKESRFCGWGWVLENQVGSWRW